MTKLNKSTYLFKVPEFPYWCQFTIEGKTFRIKLNAGETAIPHYDIDAKTVSWEINNV